MGANSKVYQYTLKNEPTGNEMYNYSFKNGRGSKSVLYSAKKWLRNGKCTSIVQKMGAIRKRIPEPLYDAM
jgi:hypothetical protein